MDEDDELAEAVFSEWMKGKGSRPRAGLLLKAAEEKSVQMNPNDPPLQELVEQELLHETATDTFQPTENGLVVARRLWYQRRDKKRFFQEPLCPYPAHRQFDFEGSGGRLVCGKCHPSAEMIRKERAK